MQGLAPINVRPILNKYKYIIAFRKVELSIILNCDLQIKRN